MFRVQHLLRCYFTHIELVHCFTMFLSILTCVFYCVQLLCALLCTPAYDALILSHSFYVSSLLFQVVRLNRVHKTEPLVVNTTIGAGFSLAKCLPDSVTECHHIFSNQYRTGRTISLVCTCMCGH